MPVLQLHQRDSADSDGIHRILVELPRSGELELKDFVEPQRISTELPHSSYYGNF
jgi:hypothetical protein